ncbi:MAG: formylglycine-generating enzyme family protein [Chloroflexi bacterium]|nr:formylglycine-generating enzyme family protein [Chloroflexota bacterium]
MNKIKFSLLVLSVLLLAILSCNLPRGVNVDSTSSEEDGAESAGEDGSTTSTDNETTLAEENQPAAPTNTDGAITIYVPGGTFQMGSTSEDPLAGEDELPAHEVTLGGFHIYTSEVTYQMYAACVESGACISVKALDTGPTQYYGDPAFANHPVVGVDWVMARDYCEWSNGRLPTEAEWELAARSTEGFRYPWGEEDPSCDRVNMLGCQVPPNTLIVGSLALGNSPYDLWDMGGNVWEWVHDWYAENYYLFSTSLNPLGPPVNQNPDNPAKVVRGGGLYSESDQIRSAARQDANPYRPYDDVGFRCVADNTQSLPDIYATASDRHERGSAGDPDGGGEHVEEPGIFDLYYFGIGRSAASCPTTDENIRIVVEAMSAPPAEWSLSVGGIPFDCFYNEALEVLLCEGPTPDGYLEADPAFHFEICLENESVSSCFTLGAVRPEDCEERGAEPLRHSIDLDCPRDGIFNITFGFEPLIDWDTVRLGGIDITCHPVDLNHITCTVPDIPDGDHYEFYLHGTDASGEEYTWTPWAPMLDDCPVDWADYDIFTNCYDRYEPFVDIYHPETEVIESVSVDGIPLECWVPFPNVDTCRLPDATIGEIVGFEFCYADGLCFTDEVTYLDCSVSEPEITYFLDPFCRASGVPAVEVQYSPKDRDLAIIIVGDPDVVCEEVWLYIFFCSDPRGSAGALWTLDIFSDAAPSTTHPSPFPPCRDPPPAVEIWELSAVDCHDEDSIYVIIDTHIDELVPGSGYFINMYGFDIDTFGCDHVPGHPGRLYCSFPFPEDPAALGFCVTPPGDGAEEICTTFDGFVPRIPATCAEEAPPEDEDDGEEPSEDEEEEETSCGDFGNQGSCQSNGCVWTKGPPDGLEHCYEP